VVLTLSLARSFLVSAAFAAPTAMQSPVTGGSPGSVAPQSDPAGDGGCTWGGGDDTAGTDGTQNWYGHFCSPGSDPSVTVPCGEWGNGIAYHGCQSSANVNGAALTVDSGDCVLDDVVMIAYDERPGALSIFLQGAQRTSSGLVFGDGVRCVSGSLKRLYTHSAPGGAITAPQSGEPSIRTRSAALGDTIPSPASRYYQVWYRDGPGHFNITSALQIDWP